MACFDDMHRRCPRLGGPVSFGYCRAGGEDRNPCFKVFDCWWERFDVVEFFHQRLPAEAFDRLQCAPVPDKMASLVDLIRKAQARAQQKP